MIRLLLLIILPVIISACADVNSIFRTTLLDEGFSPVTDAKQRIIANTRANVRGGRNHPRRILCTEPSPDVAQALASAFTAAANVQGQGGGNASASTAEGVAQLGERLGTIQLLRDGLYRACEAFANGAITETSYALIVSRIDDVMVTLLSSEMAAGAFGRELAAINASAGAGTAGGDQAAVAAARGELTTAERELSEARDTQRNALQELSAATEDSAKSAAQQKVNAANSEVRDKQAKVDLARQALTAAQAGSAVANAVARAGGTIVGGGSKNGSANVAQIYRDFTRDSQGDSVVTACIIALDKSPSNARRHAHSDIDTHEVSKVTGLPVQRELGPTELTDVCRGMFKPDSSGEAPIMKMARQNQRYQTHLAMIDNSPHFAKIAEMCATDQARNNDVCNVLSRWASVQMAIQ